MWPVVLYGCETWTLRAADIAKLRAFETTCFRRVLGISWSVHKTNEFVLSQMGTARELVSTVRKQKLQYFRHVIRAQNLSTHILEGRINGKRNGGRPKSRWLDDIKDWTGRPLTECTAMARDRDQWRTTVRVSMVPTLRNEEGIRQGKASRRIPETVQYMTA